MINHVKGILSQLEAISGVSSVRRGNPGDVELSPEFAKHIATYEVPLEKHFANTGFTNCAIAGKVINIYEWRVFLKNRDYYTSPLYRALL